MDTRLNGLAKLELKTIGKIATISSWKASHLAATTNTPTLYS